MKLIFGLVHILIGITISKSATTEVSVVSFPNDPTARSSDTKYIEPISIGKGDDIQYEEHETEKPYVTLYRNNKDYEVDDESDFYTVKPSEKMQDNQESKPSNEMPIFHAKVSPKEKKDKKATTRVKGVHFHFDKDMNVQFNKYEKKPKVIQSTEQNPVRFFADIKEASQKAKKVKKSKKVLENKHREQNFVPTHIKPERYVIDNILNVVGNFRRKADSDDYDSSSEDSEEKWKRHYKQLWLMKEQSALATKPPPRETLNMVALSGGAKCRDPTQHEVLWGTCLPQEYCPSVFRIFRGDHYCSQLVVCCALQQSTFDTNQALDLSMASDSYSSEEKKKKHCSSKERRKRQREKRRRKRRKQREERKKKIKKTIKKIIKYITNLLNRQYRNATNERRKKTRELQRFIDLLKKQYKKDRHAVKDLHEETLIRIDVALQKRIHELLVLNRDFMKNATFKAIDKNHFMTKKQARMLRSAFPELADLLPLRRGGTKFIILPRDYF